MLFRFPRVLPPCIFIRVHHVVVLCGARECIMWWWCVGHVSAPWVVAVVKIREAHGGGKWGTRTLDLICVMYPKS